MSSQAFNPYLPSYEYVPDGEPRVFGDRLYIFGSHDRFNGHWFCVNDYVCWSAPLNDLGDWKYEGVIYRKDQDPHNKKGSALWAPDVIKGCDGRYYLYYCVWTGAECGVAVCDTPCGQYEFYGYVRHEDGRIVGNAPGDFRQFDPGVLIDDDDSVYLFSGIAPLNKRSKKNRREHSMVMQLCEDMLTVRGEIRKFIPGLVDSQGTGFEGHAFFEASSPRKIEGKYYFVYSSVLSHELCYAISDSPLSGYQFAGIIISNADIGYLGNTRAVTRMSNTHGGLVCAKGQWYIFYHRHTHRRIMCRQGCAEPVTIAPDGTIAQVCVTSCGLNGGPLAAEGTYEARIVCNLYGNVPNNYSAFIGFSRKFPYITQDGADGDENSKQYIANLKSGFCAGFKYFDLNGAGTVSVVSKGSGTGVLVVSTEKDGAPLASIPIIPGRSWHASGKVALNYKGTAALFFKYQGKGRVDLLSFTLDMLDTEN